jgi:kynureninase
MAQTREFFWEERRLSIRMIAEMVNMDKETIRQILHDLLNMRKICARMVPKNLTQEHKDNWKTFALTSWNESQNNWMCLKMSSHVTKRGFFNTIRK